MTHDASGTMSEGGGTFSGRLLEWRGHRWIALAARLYLGQLFFLAAIHKVADPRSFAIDVATYQLLPIWFVNLFAVVVPPIELAVGVLLILGLYAAGAAWVVSALMLAFMIALGWALHLGLDMTCGCFASQGAAGEDPISGLTVLRDAGWLALALYIVVFDRAPVGFSALVGRVRAKYQQGDLR